MDSLTREAFERLVAPGPRLDWLVKWLTDSVWSRDRLETLSSIKYLEDGERTVNALEEVLAGSAPRVYDELTRVPSDRDLSAFLGSDEPTGVVIFDGLSLRELPILVALAEKAGRTVLERGVGFAAVPSETVAFVEQRVGCGRTGPSQLPGRRDLKQRGVSAHYFAHLGDHPVIDPSAQHLLLWSSFPDERYKDSEARFAGLFSTIQVMLETAWKNTVMAVPRGRRILITSDHGYVFMGAGMSFQRTRDESRPLTEYLGGERSARISEHGEPPAHEDLLVFPDRDLAILRGRVPLHPSGPAANKLYKHGGLSLMEMLTPWVVIGP